MPPIITHKMPSPAEFKFIRDMAGWGEIALTEAKAALAASLFGICLHLNGEIIGMARVIGDGQLNLYIQDVVVHPAHRGKGYGELIMQSVVAKLSEDYPETATIGLLAAEGLDGFYQSLGFTARPAAGFGSGMSASLQTLAKAAEPA